MKNIIPTFLIITMILAYIVLGYVVFSLMYTPKYFEPEEPFVVENKSYHIGETLTYKVKYCKYREYIATRVERNLADGFLYPLPDSTSLKVFPIGCHQLTVDVPLILPTKTPVNQLYHIEITMVIPINALKSETRTFKTTNFTLLPATK